MADNKKYYYLKLKENFFESDTMILLESQKDGYLYSNILLKLYLRSLKNEGRLAFNNLIPYNVEMLATLTRHQVGTVEKALRMFEQLGLIEVLDNGVIYMTDIQNFIGKSSSEADRQRSYQRRIAEEKQSLLPSGEENCKKSCKKSNRKFTPEIELEIETEKRDRDRDRDRVQRKKTPNGAEKIISLYTDNPLLIDAIKAFVEQRKANKSVMTDRALEMLLHKLDTLASSDSEKIQILNEATINGWKSVYPLKKGSEKNAGNGNIEVPGLHREHVDTYEQDYLAVLEAVDRACTFHSE